MKNHLYYYHLKIYKTQLTVNKKFDSIEKSFHPVNAMLLDVT